MKKYKIIYADPPWSYESWSKNGEHKSVKNHYGCMSVDDIKKIPVNTISEDNSILFLWTTGPFLEKSFDVIKSWGFSYKTIGFNWVKKNKKSDSWFWGMGYYTRSNSELCLIATKGKPLNRISKSVHQLLDDKIMSHSEKPITAMNRIVNLFGDVPRIELFARRKTLGWDSWGNEVESDITL